MKKLVSAIAMAAVAVSAPIMASAATGTPQRDDRTPPGLAKLLLGEIPGMSRALLATAGSNSRLQDLPASP